MGRSAPRRVLLLEGAVVSTWDWQTQYNFTKDIKGTFGVLNIFNKKPRSRCRTVAAGTRADMTGAITTRSACALRASWRQVLIEAGVARCWRLAWIEVDVIVGDRE
jgi:hypothetical protein